MALVSKRGHPDWFLAPLYELPPATLDEALAAFDERPEDCNKPCWRHVDGGGQCECAEDEGGTWQPGC